VSARCPVCESELPEEAWIGNSASFHICHTCGIHFGYDDAREDLRLQIYRRWREAWIANGRRVGARKDWRDMSKKVIAQVLVDSASIRAER
jgi:Zn ribbon nucleic-acid-binding protein